MGFNSGFKGLNTNYNTNSISLLSLQKRKLSGAWNRPNRWTQFLIHTTSKQGLRHHLLLVQKEVRNTARDVV